MKSWPIVLKNINLNGKLYNGQTPDRLWWEEILNESDNVFKDVNELISSEIKLDRDLRNIC